VCLVTGAGGLIGSALCEALAPTYDVVAAYRSSPPPVATQDASPFDPLRPRAAVAEAAHPVHAVRADLQVAGDLERLVEVALARFGGVDLLVNAAADVAGTSLTTDAGQVDRWSAQLLLNAVAPVQLAALLAEGCWRADPHANRLRRRSVVNVSSTAGLARPPGRGRGFYGASKAALNCLTRQMAVEYGVLGVRVNAVAPTFVPSVVPAGRVVEAVRALDAGEGTGQVLVLDADGTRAV
jgi:NAD(P)-dependent dehydrogenase (short-subunit alcohol dehydrogenase family)